LHRESSLRAETAKTGETEYPDHEKKETEASSCGLAGRVIIVVGEHERENTRAQGDERSEKQHATGAAALGRGTRGTVVFLLAGLDHSGLDR